MHAITEPTIEENCDSITSLAINSAPESTGVTSFLDEATVCATAPVVAPSTGFAAGSDDVQDLKEYFRRPRLVQAFNASTSRSSLLNIDVDRVQIFTTWFPAGLTRLEGVQGIRFTMKFMLTCASNPFHQGLVALAFQYDATNTTTEQFNRANSIALVTQLPHVRLDLSEHTAVNLEIPFLHDQDFIPLDNTAVRPYGTLSVSQVLPTPSLVNSGPATFKLFVYLEDLELIGAAPINYTTVTAQSGIKHSTQPKNSKANQINEELKKTKVISRVTSALGTGMAVASAAFPPLAAIGGPTAWFLHATSKVASSLGYSKPRDENEPARMLKTDYVGEINIDMPNEAFSLAPFATNKLRVDSTMGGTDEDEMLMEPLLARYSQIFVGDMATTDSTGSRLYATNVSPNYFWFRTNSLRPGGNLPFPATANLTTNCVQPSIICYLAQFFRYWRGGLTFKFSFAKTKFHGGRVIVGFVPTSTDVVSNGPGSSVVQALEVSAGLPQPFSYSKIFDLRDGNEFEFDVDYLSPSLYLGIGGTIGGLTLTVLDPLITNGEASGTITYLVEVKAKNDFQFSFPSIPNFTAVLSNSSYAFFQSGLGVTNARDPDEHTIGEKFTSVKQLMMLPNYTTIDVANASVSLTSLPYWMYLPRLNPSVPQAVPTQGYFACNRAGLLAAMYAYWNGATAYHVYKDGDTTGVSHYIGYSRGDAFNGTALNGASIYAHTTLTSANLAYSNLSAGHFEAPTYSKYPRISTRSIYTATPTRYFIPGGSSFLVDFNSTCAGPQLNIRNTSGSAKRLVLSVAAADDARATTFIGVPPIFLFQSTQTVSPETSSTAF